MLLLLVLSGSEPVLAVFVAGQAARFPGQLRSALLRRSDWPGLVGRRVPPWRHTCRTGVLAIEHLERHRAERPDAVLLFMAARPGIQKHRRWRQLDRAATVLAALIVLAQGISGPWNLLEMPQRWQKPVIYGCSSMRIAIRLPSCRGSFHAAAFGSDGGLLRRPGSLAPFLHRPRHRGGVGALDGDLLHRGPDPRRTSMSQSAQIPANHSYPLSSQVPRRSPRVATTRSRVTHLLSL